MVRRDLHIMISRVTQEKATTYHFSSTESEAHLSTGQSLTELQTRTDTQDEKMLKVSLQHEVRRQNGKDEN